MNPKEERIERLESERDELLQENDMLRRERGQLIMACKMALDAFGADRTMMDKENAQRAIHTLVRRLDDGVYVGPIPPRCGVIE